MLLSDFLANPENEHKTQGNPKVKSNALHKTEQSFNCYLTASQAIEHARHLLQKAQLILDHELQDAVVHVWNVGKSANLRIGLNVRRKSNRKGPRRKKSQ